MDEDGSSANVRPLITRVKQPALRRLLVGVLTYDDCAIHYRRFNGIHRLGRVFSLSPLHAAAVMDEIAPEDIGIKQNGRRRRRGRLSCGP